MKFREAIEEVRSRTDIVEIVGAHVPLKRAGRNHKGLCPFHAEKTPSFTVSPEKQLFHCFGCGEGGSAFDFVMKIRNYSFREALEYLASHTGVMIDHDDAGDRRAEARRSAQRELTQVNEIALQYFHQTLKFAEEAEPVRKYLADRGVDENWIDKLHLGYAPQSWEALTQHFSRKGVLLKRAEEVGLLGARQADPDHPLGYYDRFRHRLMFPIVSAKGETIAFGGRALKKRDGTTDDAKYYNSPQSALFDKSRSFYLLELAMESIRKNRHVVVVEGYMDAIAMHQHGFDHTVATLGTALTTAHGRYLGRFADRVTVIFDGDVAGTRAARRALGPLVQGGLEADVVLLPEGEDPDSILRQQGREQFESIMASAQPILEFCCRQAEEEATTKRALATAYQEIVSLFQSAPNRLQRELWLKEFHQLTGLTIDALRGMHQSQRRQSQRLQKPTATSSATQANQPIYKEEIMLVALFFSNETVYQLVRTYEGPQIIHHPLLKQLVDEQVNANQQSASDLGALLQGIYEESLKKQLQAALFQSESVVAEEQVQMARDCMHMILRKRFQQRIRQLREQITEAEKADNHDQLGELLREHDALMKTKITDAVV